MSQPPQSTIDFDLLTIVKEHINTKVRKDIKDQAGIDLYQKYIQDHLDDFLVNIESNLESLATESVNDEDLNYDSFNGE